MANGWPTPPLSPEPADTDVAAGDDAWEERLRGISFPPYVSQVVDNLRASASVEKDMDTLLSGVTLAAFELTGATGAALALRTEGAVICRASLGETAPPVGAKLDMDSGISGECLRTGVAQLCFDVLVDSRVDAEASRRLGVESLAAVPLRNQDGVTGILEIFSDRSHAFTESHIAVLRRLAEIAVTGRSSGAETDAQPPDRRNPEKRATAELALSTISRAPILNQLGSAIRKRGSLTQVVSGIAVLAVLASLGWLALRTFRTPTSAALPGKVQGVAYSPHEVASSATSPTGGASNGLTPVREKPSARLEANANDVVVRASDAAPLHRNLPLQVTPGKSLGRTGGSTPDSADEINPPEVFQLLADPQGNSAQVPTAIVISSVQLPREKPQVSQGLTGGTLVRRVAPTYPRLARSQKIEGTVALQAVVGEDGGLHEVKVVSGDVVLARAARQAVEQWRYAPYQLNGKPVSMRTNITVQFKLPE